MGVLRKTAPRMTGCDTPTSETSLQDTQNEFNILCQDLNMDTETSVKAWTSYKDTRKNYTLEGDQMHWLACSLYVACRLSSTPTVGQTTVLQGNGVSLTRLLRSTKLPLVQFFSKARLWADMLNISQEIRGKIEKLERNFAVSNNIFKKFQPIFVDLFRDPSQDPNRAPRSRKQKRPPCSPGELFDFCWTLFIRVKGEFPSISDDLVNSYHLLLSCVDYMFGCAWVDKREDLINPSFDSGALGETGSQEPPCILDKLCTMHDGIINEVKSIREHFFKQYINRCFDNKLLISADTATVTGILDTHFFDANIKNIRKDYETYVLSIGEYDERVFLGEEAQKELGTTSKMVNGEMELGENIKRRNLQFNNGTSLIPCTPLSGRHYLKAREQSMMTPVSTASYLVTRLNKMVAGRKPEPSVKLSDLLTTCSATACQDIVTRVSEMGNIFTERYTKPSESHPGAHASFAATRLRMGQVLYFRVLENILTDEQKRGKTVAHLVDQAVFHQALFAACLEVVIFSYSSQRTFPWVLETFNLEAFYFYKVIEVLIRAEEGLVRDVVKHLQRCEEQILESRAWESHSPVWEAISQAGCVPSSAEVSLSEPGDLVTSSTSSPLSHHLHSPIIGDRFKSPVVSAFARRQLQFDRGSSQSLLSVSGGPQNGLRAPPSPMKPSSTGIGLVTTAHMAQNSPMKHINSKPKRTNSLGLFFRKVYHLAHLRLDNLCSSMMVDDEVKKIIWTCLEWSLKNCTELMRDRHLDQVIMCALYIVSKVTGRTSDNFFTEIMKNYRKQPQCASHVYRSVLLTRGSRDLGSHLVGKNAAPCPPTPSRMANSSTVDSTGEEGGDLIKFYNDVFRPLVQEFALKFKKGGDASDKPPLSPVPHIRLGRQHAPPCRKVSEAHSVFIRPLKPQMNLFDQSPNKPLTWSFSRSPGKDLLMINEMVKKEGRGLGRAPAKRLLIDNDDSEEDVGGPPASKMLVMQPQPGDNKNPNNMVELILGRQQAVTK